MAEIATYLCDNGKCVQFLRVAKQFPAWRPDTPRNLRTPLPSAEALAFVTHFRSESYCTTCNSVVDIVEDTCTLCGNTLIEEAPGSTCPRCNAGTLSLTHLRVY